MEADLDEEANWTAARLDPFAQRLSALAVRRHDLSLFREAVPESARSSLPQLAMLNSAVSQLGARVFEVRSRVSSATFGGTDEDRQAELRHLERLSRRLAEAAGN